jgi:hypothetical protein
MRKHDTYYTTLKYQKNHNKWHCNYLKTDFNTVNHSKDEMKMGVNASFKQKMGVNALSE